MKIRTKVEFAGVPAGTQGLADLEPDGRLYKVTWDLTSPERHISREKPLVDWFTQQEFNRYLEVVA